jgi:hypothetical protein
MRLEDLTVALRPRLPWEAADLGCSIVRRDFASILGLWAVTIFPLWIALAFALKNHPLIFSGIVWWLKPLYDRIPLHFISRATFGARPGFRETWKAWPRLAVRFILPSLLWRRVSPGRSFVLPVWLLEGQKGKSLRSRVRGLAGEGGSSGAGLTWVFVKLELATFAGLLALTSILAPESGLPEFTDLMDADSSSSFTISNSYYWWTNLWYLVAMTIVEPFYVGAGFGLYLNCRTKLEGWDIELAFRRTASRITQAATVAFLLFLFLTPLSTVSAQTESRNGPAPKSDSPTQPSPNELAKSVLEEPEFKVHSKTDRIWIPDKETEKSAMAGIVGHIITGVGYLLLVIIIALLIIWIVRAASRARPPIRSARAQTPPPTQYVLGMPITPESLPADLIAAARSAWLDGNPKEALSLLYRGALGSLVARYQVPINASDTEADCLARLDSPATSAFAPYFLKLTSLWTQTAYAGLPPSPTDFESLCSSWPFHTPLPSPARTTRLLIPLLALLLPACNGRWEDITRETGFKGPARIDPFLAASRFLEKRGHSPDRAPTLVELPEATSGIVFTSAENGMPSGRALPILKWVSDGGHLVYTLAGAGPYNDWSLFSALSSYGYFGNDERPDPILQALKVTAKDRRTPEEIDEALGDILKPEKNKTRKEKPTEEKSKTDKEEEIEKPEDVSLTIATLRWRKRDIKVELPDYVTFQTERKLRNGDFIAGTPDAAHILSLRHGNGRITLLSHARPLRNRYLADHDHGLFLDSLAGAGPLDALFVIGLGGSFWELLWERAWRPIVALALAIALWLWMRLPRFGPVRSVALHSTKRFYDHLTTLGSFFLSIRRHDHLVAAAQFSLNQQLQATHPHLTDPADQHTLLATRANLPLDRVQFALADPQSLPSSQIIRILQDLQTLRLSLS